MKLWWIRCDVQAGGRRQQHVHKWKTHTPREVNHGPAAGRQETPRESEEYRSCCGRAVSLGQGSRKESAPQVLLPEEEKIIVEETRSNGQTVIEEKSLVDTVYALKDEVQELKQDSKKMKKSLEEEQRARKELEKLIRKVLKNMNDPSWDETNL